MPLPPSLPPVRAQAGLILYNSEDGQKEGKGLSGPQGQPGQEESEEGHCLVVEVDHHSGSSLLLGYLLWGRFWRPVCQAAENVPL